MKRAQVFFWTAVIGLTFVLSAADAADKFGYVDLRKVFSEYGKTKDYDKVLTEKQKTYENEREKKVNEIKTFQDNMNLLNDKEKEAKKGDLEAKVKALQEYDRAKQTDLRKEQNDKMQEILKDLEDTVKQYAAKEGYTMVFNESVLVYEDKSLDITDKIVGIINKASAAPAKK
ncbi:MAG: OmpH family outer membrane protein [Candidatus Omnitrophota bacterium]|jgi:Skp family chaperone for outer membrane proteins